MNTASDNPQSDAQSEQKTPDLLLECRPQVIFGAVYDQLPFPQLAPMQEVAFDLGVTARGADFQLTGLVVRGFAGHQLLFEQRWPHRFILEKTGLPNTDVPQATGIALRAMHFQLHAYEKLTMMEFTVVANSDTAQESAQFQLRVPVEYPVAKTDLHFPLEGAWWVIQAADWSDVHKLEVVSQPFAMDFVKLDKNGQFFHGTGEQLPDHTSWDQPVYAAAGGKVAYVCADMPDIAPGTAPDPRMFRDDPRRLLGNAVAISHGNGEFSYYAHLQQASTAVQYGEVVRRGDLLGRVGNSGLSPGPHLHFHVMNGPNLQLDQGIPFRFSHLSAGGQYYERPISIPTRMIVTGPDQQNQVAKE